MEDNKSVTLKQKIKAACKTGDFTLTSGKKSNFYIDIKGLLLKPDFLTDVGEEINHIVLTQIKEDVFAVGGMELGSVPISTATCICSDNNLEQFIIRKTKRKHGTQSQVEGWDSIKDKNIVLVDDVITTGGSLLKMIDIVSEHTNIVAIIAIVDREDTSVAKVHDIPVISLFKKSELM